MKPLVSMPSSAHACADATLRLLSFGGVEIELLTAPDFRLVLPESHADLVSRPEGPPPVARVACNVTVDASLSDDPGESREIVLSAGRLRTKGVRARLRRLGRGGWVAAARVAPGAQSMGRLLDGLSAAILEQAGGLLMHAAGVELDGLAYLFIGPSGAGKTTAAGQVFGARSFCVDRVAVALSNDETRAFVLPGGTDPIDGAPKSPRRSLPLGGVLRVVQAQALDVRAIAPHEALMMVRESVFSADRDRTAEHLRLDAIERLIGRVPVARLKTPLGAPLAQSLRQLGQASSGARS